MKLRFVVAALAVSALASCSKQTSDLPVRPDGTVELKISVADETTKATDTSGEDKVNTLQVFVFSENDKLEAYETVNSSSSLTVGVLSGKKTIHALVNAPALIGISEYKDLYAKLSALKDNSLDNFVMEGWKSVEVGQEGASATIGVNRLVAKVSLLKVENQLADIYSSMTFKLMRAYLINVAGDRTYGAEAQTAPAPKEWFNQMKYVSDDGVGALTLGVYETSVAHLKANEPKDHFYCYPNPTVDDTSAKPFTARHTRLVVEVELGGTLYYYPVTLPVVDQNTHYQVSLAVTRPGSDDPDVPFNPGDAKISIEVLDWTDGGTINEKI